MTNDTANKPRSVLRKVGGAAYWALGVRYFNPVNWIKGDGTYKRGSIVSTAYTQMRSVWRIKDDSEYRHETFEDAMERLGLKESDIEEKLEGLTFECFSLYAISALILIASFYYAISSNYISCFAGLLMSIACSTAAFSRAFRIWQLRQKRFGSFKEFAFIVEAWIP